MSTPQMPQTLGERHYLFSAQPLSPKRASSNHPRNPYVSLIDFTSAAVRLPRTHTHTKLPVTLFATACFQTAAGELRAPAMTSRVESDSFTARCNSYSLAALGFFSACTFGFAMLLGFAMSRLLVLLVCW